MRWVKSLFGAKTEDEGPALAIGGVELPLGLRLGGAVALDTALFDAAGDAFGFVAPRGHQLIETYGQIDLGAGSILHRFYLSDDAFLQVNTTAGVIDEMKYFVFHDTRRPSNQAAFKEWVREGSTLGSAQIEIANRRYARVWGDDQAHAWAPPVVFEEVLFSGRPPAKSDELTHYAMLYEREIPSLDRTESLLLSAEDYGPNEFCVVYSLGIDVSSADLDIT